MKFENLPSEKSEFHRVSIGTKDLQRIEEARVSLEKHYNGIKGSEIVAKFSQVGSVCSFWEVTQDSETFEMNVNFDGKVRRHGH